MYISETDNYFNFKIVVNDFFSLIVNAKDQQKQGFNGVLFGLNFDHDS